MKKTKRQKAFEWKHLMNNPHKFPYMQHKNPRNQRMRFNIGHFKKTINILFEASIKGEFPHSKRGDRAGTFLKGYHLNYQDMKYKIVCHGDGVKNGGNNLTLTYT